MVLTDGRRIDASTMAGMVFRRILKPGAPDGLVVECGNGRVIKWDRVVMYRWEREEVTPDGNE